MTNEAPDKLSTQIDAIVKSAVAEAIEKHRRLDQSISIWKDGRVVTLTAEEIPSIQKTEITTAPLLNNEP